MFRLATNTLFRVRRAKGYIEKKQSLLLNMDVSPWCFLQMALGTWLEYIVTALARKLQLGHGRIFQQVNNPKNTCTFTQ